MIIVSIFSFALNRDKEDIIQAIKNIFMLTIIKKNLTPTYFFLVLYICTYDRNVVLMVIDTERIWYLI
mgnify:CR=1 FL=1